MHSIYIFGFRTHQIAAPRYPYHMPPSPGLVRRFIRVTILLVVGFLSLSSIIGVFVAEGALHPGRRPFSAADNQEIEELARRFDSDWSNVSMSARDGITLRAWHVHPHRGTGDAVILLHGLSDNRLGMLGYAEILLDHGFDLLMPDARSHGASGGPLATYGLLESDDVKRWFTWLQQTAHPTCIFGFAESMGAAVLLQSLPSESGFCAVAGESPFSNFREISYDRMGQFFHTGPWLGRTILRPVVESAFFYTRWKYHLDFGLVSPENAVANTHVPVFLIHGQVDSNIPLRHSRRIAARNSGVSLWEVPSTDHCGAINTAPDQFAKKLFAWFASHRPLS
ncbi:MAG: alpha/beta hydrolase [Candidatus Acidiferrum sp.]